MEHVSSAPERPSLQTLKSTLPHQSSTTPARGEASLRQELARRGKRMLAPFWRVTQVARNVCLDLFSNTDLADFDADGEEAESEAPHALNAKLFFQRRFAAGQAFTLDFFGNALGHIYHFPPSIELMEALTMPARRGQASYPWQVRCPPEWAGRAFGELLRVWLLGGDAELPEAGTALALALYRARAEAAGGSGSEDDQPPVASQASLARGGGYNVTLPAPSSELRASDLVTVLAGQRFGQLMAQRGLLCGAEAGADVARGEGKAPSLPHGGSKPSMVSIPESEIDEWLAYGAASGGSSVEELEDVSGQIAV